MSWFRRGAASVLDRELGQWPYPIGFTRVLLDRDRATANDLEADVCSFTYASFRTVGYTLRVLVQMRLNKIRRETLDPVGCFL